LEEYWDRGGWLCSAALESQANAPSLSPQHTQPTPIALLDPLASPFLALTPQGKFAIIKDLAQILPDAVLPDGAIVPSMTVWGGNPARIVDTLPETYQETIEDKCKNYYSRFRST
jgi:hypothetical protein